MSQISPPIRILLVCAVAFLAAWMLFLRPSSDPGTPAAETPATTAPPVEAGGEKAGSLAGKAVEKANEATAAQDARAEELAGGTGETATTPQPANTTTATVTKTGAPADVDLPSKQELRTVPADVRRAFEKRQIVVLGVVGPKASDDKLVRKALAKVDKLHGRVFVKTIPVKRISRYGSIMRGSDVSQTPSVVVVDFGFKATTLAGWVDATTIDQAVVDAIRASGTLYLDPYLKQVARACTQWFPQVNVVLEPTSVPEARRVIGQTGAAVTDFKRELAAISTPPKWRAFSRATRADLTTAATALENWQAAFSSAYTMANLMASMHRFEPAFNRAGDSLNTRFDRYDVLACGSKG
jgi:hypothetical protein